MQARKLRAGDHAKHPPGFVLDDCRHTQGEACKVQTLWRHMPAGAGPLGSLPQDSRAGRKFVGRVHPPKLRKRWHDHSTEESAAASRLDMIRARTSSCDHKKCPRSVCA